MTIERRSHPGAIGDGVGSHAAEDKQCLTEGTYPPPKSPLFPHAGEVEVVDVVDLEGVSQADEPLTLDEAVRMVAEGWDETWKRRRERERQVEIDEARFLRRYTKSVLGKQEWRRQRRLGLIS